MKSISRRKFFKTSTAVAAGCAIPASNMKTPIMQDTPPKIKRYKPFGKTGWEIGDISSGYGQADPNMILYQYECGINLFDTARQYGDHELTLGQVWNKIPRDKVFIVSKWDPYKLTKDTKKAEILTMLDESLERLNTTYVDCMMIHGIGHPSTGDITLIQNPEIYEAYDEAKRLGKVKFTGASGCGPNIINEMEWGIDNDRFEVVLLGANFITYGLEPLLKKARDKGIATIAMKSMTIYKADLNIEGLKDKNTNARQAVIKYMLASDLFDTMIIGQRNYEMINEYVSVSGTTTLDEDDDGLLETLSAIIGTKYCRPGCDGCYGTCPNDVRVWDILRYKMYFENYGNEKYAMEKYR
ncbi:MAG: aldo/keto reductase, partial [bacterium]|nr:aldo/keto reductase [bacterium]